MVYHLTLLEQCQARDGIRATTQYSFICDTHKVIIIYFAYNYNSLCVSSRIKRMSFVYKNEVKCGCILTPRSWFSH